MSRPYKIVAVIPCLNEEKNIFNVVLKTSKFVDLVLVINDGSSDNTEYEAKRAGAIVINHQRNLGKGAALNTAFVALKDYDCNAAVLIDGDGQHNPNDIPQLLKKFTSENLDMVIGSRFLKKNRIPKYRMVGQYVLNIAINLGSGIPVTDTQSGFRVVSPKAYSIFRFKEKGLSVESEMQFQVSKFAFSVGEVPIDVIYEGKSRRNPIIHGFSVLFRVFSLIGQYRLNLTIFSEEKAK